MLVILTFDPVLGGGNFHILMIGEKFDTINFEDTLGISVKFKVAHNLSASNSILGICPRETYMWTRH